MTGFMGDPGTTFKTFIELGEIFAHRRETLAREGDPSNDLRVLPYAASMIARQWESPIVFRRDDDGRIGDGIHRGIAYLRCLREGLEPSRLPQLLLAPRGSYQWPPGLKERIESTQH